ncbi:MAG: hypothetical protein ACFFDY_09160 [Candidatus Thorarchaeota archaeon]
MGKILRDLWILTEDGLTLFSRVINPNIGPQVFGGLMSALNTFAENLSEGGMTKFELSSVRFTIEKKHNFLFVANSSNDVKPKKVMKELKKVAELFFKVYPEDIIKNWSRNIKEFSNFKEHISDSLEEII